MMIESLSLRSGDLEKDFFSLAASPRARFGTLLAELFARFVRGGDDTLSLVRLCLRAARRNMLSDSTSVDGYVRVVELAFPIIAPHISERQRESVANELLQIAEWACVLGRGTLLGAVRPGPWREIADRIHGLLEHVSSSCPGTAIFESSTNSADPLAVRKAQNGESENGTKMQRGSNPTQDLGQKNLSVQDIIIKDVG